MRPVRSKRHGGYMERGISALIADSATLSRLEGEPPKTPELRIESDETETDDDSFVTTSQPWTDSWNGQDLNIRFGHGVPPFEKPFVATIDQDHEGITEHDDENLFQDSIIKSRHFLDPNMSLSQRSLGRIDENTNPPPRVKTDIFHSSLPDRGKIMTAAQFENYREVKGRQDSSEAEDEAHGDAHDGDSDNEGEDEAAISKRHRNARRKQEAHITNYRKNMTKTTGDPNLRPHMSAPSTPLSPLSQDDDVPLALLQVHRRSNESRPPTRLGNAKSNPTLRTTIQQPVRRPSTARSITSQQAPTRRPSTARSVASQQPCRRPSTAQSKQNPNSPLPVFARGLPHDPFGANNRNVPSGAVYPPPQAQQSLYPGGLVSVIAIEQRTREMRRRAPTRAPKMNPQQQSPMHWGGGAPAYQYGQVSSMYGVPGMQQEPLQVPQAPPTPSIRSDVQSQIMQQTAQNLNSQLLLMQMMNCMNQQGNPNFAPMQQQPWQGYNPMPQVNGFAAHQPAPVESFSSLPGYANAGMGPTGMDYAGFQAAQQFRVNMSTHRPGTLYTPSIAPSERSNVGLPNRYRPGTMYTPSIAPSERSNVGLPSRYRPVSKAASQRGMETNTQVKDTGSINSYMGATTTGTTSVHHTGSNGFGTGQGEQGTKARKKDRRRAMWMGKRDSYDTSCTNLGCFTSQSPEEDQYSNRQWGR